MHMETNWYILDPRKKDADQRIGPLSRNELESRAITGLLTPETLVWHPDLGDWKSWGEVKEQVFPSPSTPSSTIQEHNASVEQSLPQIQTHPFQPSEDSAKKLRQAHFANFGTRAGALIVDVIILLLINALLLAIYQGIFRIPEQVIRESILLNSVGLFLDACYHIGFVWQYGGTPGKLLFGLEIVTAEGTPLSLGRSIMRYIGLILSAATLGIGFLIVLADPERRALHDHLARTRVKWSMGPRL